MPTVRKYVTQNKWVLKVTQITKIAIVTTFFLISYFMGAHVRAVLDVFAGDVFAGDNRENLSCEHFKQL